MSQLSQIGSDRPLVERDGIATDANLSSLPRISEASINDVHTEEGVGGWIKVNPLYRVTTKGLTLEREIFCRL